MRFAAVLLLTVGCAAPEPDSGRPVVFPVEGRLLVGDLPAGNAQIAFHSVNGDVARPVAVTRSDGSFRLTTHAADDGAPAGEYVVTIFWENPLMPTDGCGCPDPTAHDRLMGLYYDPAKSDLRATVKPERNVVTVHATVGGQGWNLPRVKPLPKKENERERRE